MLTKPALTIFLFSFLIFQLVTLTPHFPVASISFGDLVAVSQKNAVLLPRHIHEATFSSFAPDKKDALIFTGDILLARNVEFLMKKEGSDYPFALLNLAALSENPVVIGNFESAMLPMHVPTPPLAMNFSVASPFLASLKTAGFTHVSLANNHSFDYGKEGYDHAVHELQSYKVIPFGNGASLDATAVTFINSELGRVALVAINATERQPTPAEIRSVLATGENGSDIQIVYIHWGDEYKGIHSPSQEALATLLVDEGADLIIGHHPHVVQDVGMIDGVLVFYSLGNYIFDQYFSDDVQTGLVLALAINAEQPSVQLLPVTSLGHRSQPSYMSPETHVAFLEGLAAKSNEILASDIKKGRIPLGDLVASSQKMAMMVR